MNEMLPVNVTFSSVPHISSIITKLADSHSYFDKSIITLLKKTKAFLKTPSSEMESREKSHWFSNLSYRLQTFTTEASASMFGITETSIYYDKVNGRLKFQILLWREFCCMSIMDCKSDMKTKLIFWSGITLYWNYFILECIQYNLFLFNYYRFTFYSSE